MALAPKAAIGFSALMSIAGGAVPRAQYGGLDYSDILASAFAGYFH